MASPKIKNTARIDKVKRRVPITALTYIFLEIDIKNAAAKRIKAKGTIKNPQPKRDLDIELNISPATPALPKKLRVLKIAKIRERTPKMLFFVS